MVGDGGVAAGHQYAAGGAPGALGRGRLAFHSAAGSLMVVWFLPFMWKQGKLPRHSLPLLVFGLVAVAATALANFKMIPPYKDISILRNSVSSFATLVIGICFYIAASVYPTVKRNCSAPCAG